MEVKDRRQGRKKEKEAKDVERVGHGLMIAFLLGGPYL